MSISQSLSQQGHTLSHKTIFDFYFKLSNYSSEKFDILYTSFFSPSNPF